MPVSLSTNQYRQRHLSAFGIIAWANPIIQALRLRLRLYCSIEGNETRRAAISNNPSKYQGTDTSGLVTRSTEMQFYTPRDKLPHAYINGGGLGTENILISYFLRTVCELLLGPPC